MAPRVWCQRVTKRQWLLGGVRRAEGQRYLVLGVSGTSEAVRGRVWNPPADGFLASAANRMALARLLRYSAAASKRSNSVLRRPLVSATFLKALGMVANSACDRSAISR